MRKCLTVLVAVACHVVCAATYTVTDAKFGANGSDTEDDSYAIQNALNMAKGASERTEVVVPAGIYLVSLPLGIYSNTKLTLEKGATIRRPVGSVNKVMLYGRHLKADGTECPRDATCTHGGHSQLRDIEITGGVWDGGMDTESVTGAFALLHGEGITVRDVVFLHFTEHFVNFSASKDIVVERCIFKDALRYTGTSSEFWTYYDYDVGDSRRFNSIEAIHLDVANDEGEPDTYPHDDSSCENVTVANCEFRDVFAGAGNHHVIDGVSQNGFVVDSCTFTGLVSYAVHAHGFTNCVVRGNSAEDCAGMVWSRDASFAAERNDIASCARHGFFVVGSSAAIAGNEVDGVGLHGVYLDGGSAAISSNKFFNCMQCGVRADRCAGLSVSWNDVSASGEEGINLFGGRDIGILLNNVESAGTISIMVQNAEDLDISCNDASDCPTCGVFVKSCTDGVVFGNFISDVKAADSQGISVMECYDVEVRDNALTDCSSAGIVINGGEASVVENIITAPGKNGINAISATVTAVSNEVYSAVEAGYYLFAAGGSSFRANGVVGCKLGFDVVNSGGVTLSENSIVGSTQHGINARNASSLVVGENIVENAGERGVTVSGGDATVVGCKIISPKVFGICAENGACLVAAENEIESPGNCGVRLIGVSSASVRGCVITDAPVAGVSVSSGSSDVMVDGNTIDDCGSGFADNGTSGLTVSGNVVRNATGHGISLENSTGATVKGNTVEYAGGRGITVSGGDVAVTGNSISEPADVGIYSSSAKTTVVGNSIGRAGSSGLRLVDLDGSEIRDNGISGGTGDGMLVSSSKNLVVSGNEFQSSGGRGMLFSYCSDCDISQNLIDGAASEGIYYQYSTGGVISSNEVVKTGGFAICVAGSTSSATVESNVVTALSGHDIRIGDGAIGCTVTGNMCGGGGVGIVSSVLASTTYEPADCRVCATVDSPDNYLVEWVPAKIAVGTGSYIVEWTHSSDDFKGCSSTVVNGATSDNVVINDPSGVSHVRVRAVNTISGTSYASSGSNGYVAQVGKVCYELVPAGGTGGDRTATGTIGAALPQIAVPSRPGYDFGGYWTGRDGTGTQVYSSDGKGVSACAKDYSTVVLYASWSLAREVAVTFSASGGHPEARVVVVRAGALFSSFAPQDPVRTGYDFAGWRTKDGSAVSDDYAVPGDIDELEFSASWDVRQYHISFSANGGKGGTTSLLEFGSGIKPPEVSRTGYDLMGWSPSLPETMPAEDSTFYAQWRVHEYKVAFDAAGGIEDTVLYLGYGSAIVAPTVTRAGYTFNGWSPAVPAAVPAEDTEYVAQWEVNKYKVTFDANGGTGGYSSQMDYGTPITPPEVSRTGYDFMGWEPMVDATVPASDMKYVAQWKKKATPGPVDPDTPMPGPVDPDTPTPGPVDPDPVDPCCEKLEMSDITEPYSAPSAVVLHGAVYDGCDVVGIVELKLGKEKKMSSKIGGSVTLLNGKKYSIKAQTAPVDGVSPSVGYLPVKSLGMLHVAIGGTKFAGSLGDWHVQSASVCTAWSGKSATASVEMDDVSAFSGMVLTGLLPYSEVADVNNGKWAFKKAAGVKWSKPKKGAAPSEFYDPLSGKDLLVDVEKGKTNLSGMKLSYTPKKGTFKGSFKVYALQGSGKGTKLKKYTFKVSGVVVDGIGYGLAVCKKPMLSCPVSIK